MPTPLADNPWFQNFAVEIIAGIGAAVISYGVGRWQERKTHAKRLYAAVVPIAREIGALRRAGRLLQPEARSLIQALANGFRGVVKSSAWGQISKEYYRPPGTIMECGVCGDQVPITRDQCPHCELDCCAWDSAGSLVQIGTSTVKRVAS